MLIACNRHHGVSVSHNMSLLGTSFSKIVSVISKPSEERKDFEIISVLPWFRKKTAEVFRDLRTEILVDIVKTCQFVTKPKDGVIVRQGEIGDCMFITLSGQVSVYINYPKKTNAQIEAEENDFTDQDAKMDKGVARSLSQTTKKSFMKAVKKARGKKGEKVEETEEEEIQEDKSQYGTYVCSLGPGTTFGEVALITDDCIRTASVVCDKITDLLVIERQLYERSVRKILAKEFEDKEKFIEGSALFSKWPVKYRKQLAMAMTRLELPFERVLVKQGEPVTSIYFIVRGEVKITMDPEQHRTQYSNIWTADVVNTDKDPQQRRPKSRLLSARNRQRQKSAFKKKDVDICFQGSVEAIGDLEVFLELPTFSYTAQCTQQTDVVMLDLKHFERLVTKRNPASVEEMQETLKSRVLARFGEHIQSLAPFTKYLVEKTKQLNNSERDEMTVAFEEIMNKVEYGERQDGVVPPRGCLIDEFGPGSVFYRIRRRAKKKAIDAKNLEKYRMRSDDEDEENPRSRSKSPTNKQRPQRKQSTEYTKTKEEEESLDHVLEEVRLGTQTLESDAFILDSEQLNCILQQTEVAGNDSKKRTENKLRELEILLKSWLIQDKEEGEHGSIRHGFSTQKSKASGVSVVVKPKKKMIIRNPSEDEEEEDEAVLTPWGTTLVAHKSGPRTPVNQHAPDNKLFMELRNRVLKETASMQY